MGETVHFPGVWPFRFFSYSEENHVSCIITFQFSGSKECDPFSPRSGMQLKGNTGSRCYTSSLAGPVR